MKVKQRLVIIAVGTFFLFSLLIANYFKIQILEGEKWTRQALAQHETVIKEPFRRGSFFSNTSMNKSHPESPRPLVFDVTKFHLFVDPIAIPEEHRDEVSAQLSALADLDSEIRSEFDRKSHSRSLARWLDRETQEGILAWWHPFARKRKIARNALYFVTDYQRSYPFGKLLGQVLHTICDRKEEKTQVGLPTGGLESYFNETLKGKLGKRAILRSPLNHLETDQVLDSPEDGADIYLTINHTIQAIVEEELEKGVKAAQAKGAWATLLDPYTGEIWALAQYPFFEPANYRDYFNTPEKIELSKAKAITDAFELGSIMKPLTLCVALKAGVYTPDEKIDTTRSIFPGRGSKLLKDMRLHRAMNMNMALQKSSNVYMAQLIDRVIHEKGNDWYRNELVNTFGFSQKTGVELPGEAAGLVPTPGKLHPNGALEWSTPTPYSLSFGYNLLATNLQMARAYAIFANGGYLVEPTLVRKIVRGNELLFDRTEPPSFPQVIDPQIVDRVRQAMKFTTKPGGTGALAAVSGYTEAGKSGSAEKIVDGVYARKVHISSFVGIMPADQPRFVLIVTVDEPKYTILPGGGKNHLGGRCAAPIVREIATRTLEYLGVPPDDPYGYPPGDPRYDAEKADWIKEVHELKLLYEQWNLGNL